MYGILLLLSSIVLLFTYLCYTWRKRFDSLKHLPGPPTLPVIGNVLEFGRNPVDKLNALIRIQNTYGHVTKIWFGPKFLNLIISEPELVEFFCNSPKYITKSSDYDVLHPWLGQGLLTSTGTYWHKKRKLLTPSFHFKILEEFIPIFNNLGKIFLERLEEKVDQKAFDIYPFITDYTLDTICETAMGTSINAQTTTNNAYVKAVEDYRNVFIRRVFSVWKQSDTLFVLSNDYKLQTESLKVLHGFTKSVITKRQEERNQKLKQEDVKTTEEDDIGKKRRFAFLDMLLECKMDGRNLTDDEIREEVDTFMFEGHDTTASAIGFALYEVAHNPDVQEKLVNELRAVIGDDKERPLVYKDLQELKYMDIVLKEVLRLYPSVPIMGRLLTEDAEYKGVVYPAGLNLAIFPFAMHRREDIWKDANKFNPDRFLDENQEKKNPFGYIPFSAGPRNCIGQKFAQLEMKLIISKVLLNFEVLPSGLPYPIKNLSAEVILKSEEGVLLKLKKRNL